MISCCGLDCSLCEAFIATRENDDEKRKQVAKLWSERYKADISPEHIHCTGCRSGGRQFFYCSDRCEVRKCCMKKELDNCAACSDYPCEILKDFLTVAVESKEALEAIRKHRIFK